MSSMFMRVSALIGLTTLVSCGKPDWMTFSETKKDAISSIIEEGDVIWYGTKNGFVKFDKATEKRKVFTVNEGLSDNDIRFITMDASGKKWIATGFGLSSYDGKDWDAFDITSSKIPANQISSVAATGSVVFVGTGGGFAKFDGTDWTAYRQADTLGLLDNVVQTVAADKNGNAWLGLQDAGIAFFNGKKFISYDTTAQAPVKIPVLGIKQIVIDKNDVKWIATAKGLLKFDGKAFTQWNTKNSQIPDNLIRSLAIDAAGNKWLATTKGLVKFDGTTFTVYRPDNSNIPAERISAVYAGKDDQIWIGCEGQGLTVFKEGGVTLIEGK